MSNRQPEPHDSRYFAALVAQVTPERWQQVVDRAVEDAASGSRDARRWLGDYLIGRPASQFDRLGIDRALLARLLDALRAAGLDPAAVFTDMLRDLTAPAAPETDAPAGPASGSPAPPDDAAAGATATRDTAAAPALEASPPQGVEQPLPDDPAAFEALLAMWRACREWMPALLGITDARLKQLDSHREGCERLRRARAGRRHPDRAAEQRAARAGAQLDELHRRRALWSAIEAALDAPAGHEQAAAVRALGAAIMAQGGPDALRPFRIVLPPHHPGARHPAYRRYREVVGRPGRTAARTAPGARAGGPQRPSEPAPPVP